MDINRLSSTIFGAAIEVHRALGPGLLENAYELALAHEFALCKIGFERQKLLPVFYKGHPLPDAYRMDFLVEDCVVVQLKAVDSLQAIHDAQLLTYLKLSEMKLGLLINFNVPVLKNGIRRIANHL